MIAADDIVRSFDAVGAGAREPLLVLDPLLEFLDAHGLGTGEARIEPIGEGHSNVSFAVTRGDARLVLRRPPRGPLPPSAHDVLREARVQGALAGRVPVADVLAVCEDPAVIGAPFYVMARLDGVVMQSEAAPGLAGCERETAEAMVDALADLHAVDWRAAGLEGFARPDGYLERQLARFSGLWERNRTRDLPAMERVAAWLAAHMPASGPATNVHGDYRLGNVMYAPSPPRDRPARATARRPSPRRRAGPSRRTARRSPRGRRTRRAPPAPAPGRRAHAGSAPRAARRARWAGAARAAADARRAACRRA